MGGAATANYSSVNDRDHEDLGMGRPAQVCRVSLVSQSQHVLLEGQSVSLSGTLQMRSKNKPRILAKKPRLYQIKDQGKSSLGSGSCQMIQWPPSTTTCPPPSLLLHSPAAEMGTMYWHWWGNHAPPLHSSFTPVSIPILGIHLIIMVLLIHSLLGIIEPY